MGNTDTIIPPCVRALSMVSPPQHCGHLGTDNRCCGVCAVHSIVFSSLSGPHPVIACNTPIPMWYQKGAQIFLSVLWRGPKNPPFRTAHLHSIVGKMSIFGLSCHGEKRDLNVGKGTMNYILWLYQTLWLLNETKNGTSSPCCSEDAQRVWSDPSQASLKQYPNG